jgi:NAD(P)-dependent dehydrogenase (short-subunit alcohol dehydrogenase family)
MDGKTVVVTGANSGIGKETALALAGEGARVLMHARRPDAGERAVAEVRSRNGSEQVELLLADLSSMAQVVGLADEILDRCPRIDVLVNNAGILRPLA